MPPPRSKASSILRPGDCLRGRRGQWSRTSCWPDSFVDVLPRTAWRTICIWRPGRTFPWRPPPSAKRGPAMEPPPMAAGCERKLEAETYEFESWSRVGSSCWPGFWLVVHTHAANQEPAYLLTQLLTMTTTNNCFHPWSLVIRKHLSLNLSFCYGWFSK